jgi:hypothetical protein
MVSQKMIETWIESTKADTDTDFAPEVVQQARRHIAAEQRQAVTAAV